MGRRPETGRAAPRLLARTPRGRSVGRSCSAKSGRASAVWLRLVRRRGRGCYGAFCQLVRDSLIEESQFHAGLARWFGALAVGDCKREAGGEGSVPEVTDRIRQGATAALPAVLRNTGTPVWSG